MPVVSRYSPAGRRLERRGERGAELVVVGDERVGVDRYPGRLGRAVPDVQAGQQQRRRGPAPRRFDDDARIRQLRELRPQVGGVRLLGDDQDVIGADQRQQAVDGLLNERAFAAEREQLLRAAAAAQRPQARSFAAREDGDEGSGAGYRHRQRSI